MLEIFYLKVFINIVVDSSQTTVYVENISKNRVLNKVEKVFSTLILNDEVYEFILKYMDESPYYYISILNSSQSQGAIPTCDKSKLFFYEDVSTSNLLCINKKWSSYTSKNELLSLEQRYAKIGLDFVFSPFVLLANFFKKEMTKEIALYILLEDKFISLAIFQHSELVYAQYLYLENQVEDVNLLTYDVDLDEGIDLEDIDAIEEIDMFDDFSDIEDLDNIDDIDEFSDAQDIGNDISSLDADDSFDGENSQETDTFTADYQRFSLIKNTLNDFYNNEKYESVFIENVFIADGTGNGGELTSYLKEEMFLTVTFRNINLASAICDTAKLEIE